MAIHYNLRQLRLNCGMTQEQVAEKVGITRQALSSYESGRTHPDIDMLIRLGEIYGTDLDGILYGQERKLKAIRCVNLVAVIVLVLLTVLTVFSSSFLLMANRLFPITEGHVSGADMEILQSRIRLNKAWQITDSIILTVAFLGFALLLILLVTGKGHIPPKVKIKYAAILSAAISASAIVFGLMDPAYAVTQYIATPVLVVGRLTLFLLADLVIEYFQKRLPTQNE